MCINEESKKIINGSKIEMEVYSISSSCLKQSESLTNHDEWWNDDNTSMKNEWNTLSSPMWQNFYSIKM